MESSTRGFLEALQLRSAQKMSSWPCQMLLHADNVGPVMLGKVGHSGCHQKGFFCLFGFFLMFCLPSEDIGYLFNIPLSDLKKGCAQTSLSQMYQLVLYILVLPAFTFISAFLHILVKVFSFTKAFCAEGVKSWVKLTALEAQLSLELQSKGCIGLLINLLL